MELFVDESGNDRSDVAFVVVGTSPLGTSGPKRRLQALRAHWPVFFASGLKAATAASPGWLALRWLRAHPHPAAAGPRLRLQDLRALQFDRDRFPVALEAAAGSGAVPAAAIRAAEAAQELVLSPLDVPFAGWACAVRAAARQSPPPPGDGLGEPPLPVLAAWYRRLHMPAGAVFPALFRQHYLDALLGFGGSALATAEQPAGHLVGQPQRYLDHLLRLLHAARALGVRRVRIQGRDVAQRAATGTTLSHVLRPLTADLLRASGVEGVDIDVESFWAVADSRVGHRIADAAAFTVRRGGSAGAFSVTTVEVTP